MALNDLFKVDECHIYIARRKWYKYAIADQWPGVSPKDVEEWDAEEILEALGEIARREAKRLQGGNNPK